MDRLLLLLIACAAAAAADDEDVEWSVIWGFGRLDVYEEWREGDEVADAGDEGRNTAKNSDMLKAIWGRLEIQYSLIPWLELTEIPRVGLAWYEDDEDVEERVLGADDGDRLL
jgi:hypothetical protein